MLTFFDALALGSRPEATAQQRAELELQAQRPFCYFPGVLVLPIPTLP